MDVSFLKKNIFISPPVKTNKYTHSGQITNICSTVEDKTKPSIWRCNMFLRTTHNVFFSSCLLWIEAVHFRSDRRVLGKACPRQSVTHGIIVDHTWALMLFIYVIYSFFNQEKKNIETFTRVSWQTDSSNFTSLKIASL